MKEYEVSKIVSHTGDLRIPGVLLCVVVICWLSTGCRSSRTASQISTTERHEVFDSTSAVDTLDLTGSVASADTASVNITESSNDTIKIERDDAGRPVLVIWNHNANLLGTFGSSKNYDLDFTRFHSSDENKSAGTEDNLEHKAEESKTEIDPSIPIDFIVGPIMLGLVIIYVIYVMIADGLWPSLKKSIFSKQSNK